jgi:hypothetical protein
MTKRLLNCGDVFLDSARGFDVLPIPAENLFEVGQFRTRGLYPWQVLQEVRKTWGSQVYYTLERDEGRRNIALVYEDISK